MLGLDLVDGVRWDALGHTTGRLSARALRDSLPRRDRVAALTWYSGSRPRPLQAFAVREALSAARRGHDTVVVDLPRVPDPLTEEVAARCDQVVVVVVTTVAGVAAAMRTCARFADPGSLGLVVRGSGMDDETVSRAIGVPVLHRMPDQRGLAEAIDVGLGPVRTRRGPLGRASAGVLAMARGPCGGACGVMRIETDLVEEVRERLARESGDVTPHRVAEALRSSGRPVGDATVLAVHEALRRDVVGAGPLEPLLREPDVTDVLVNGADDVYVDRGHGLERVDVCFPDDESVRRLAQRLAASGGRRLDDATPHVDVRLRDGTRFHAVLAPLARPGTVLSLRVPHPRVLALDDLLVAGTITEHGARLVRRVVVAPTRVPGQRRHRLGQDDLAEHLAVAGAARPAARTGRGRQRAASVASARGRSRGPASQHRGRR